MKPIPETARNDVKELARLRKTACELGSPDTVLAPEDANGPEQYRNHPAECARSCVRAATPEEIQQKESKRRARSYDSVIEQEASAKKDAERETQYQSVMDYMRSKHFANLSKAEQDDAITTRSREIASQHGADWMQKENWRDLI